MSFKSTSKKAPIGQLAGHVQDMAWTKSSYLNAFKNGTETLLRKIFAFGSIHFTFAAIKLLMTQIAGLQLDMGLTRVMSLNVLEE